MPWTSMQLDCCNHSPVLRAGKRNLGQSRAGSAAARSCGVAASFFTPHVGQLLPGPRAPTFGGAASSASFRGDCRRHYEDAPRSLLTLIGSCYSEEAAPHARDPGVSNHAVLQALAPLARPSRSARRRCRCCPPPPHLPNELNTSLTQLRKGAAHFLAELRDSCALSAPRARDTTG
eukprot:363614-Chlamydomonas_euryale.AAC.4